MTPSETLRENQRLAAVLARSLCDGGVRHVVVSPGSRSTPLALAFDSLAGCNVHVVLDERAAAFIALGVGRATGRPAVVLATSGSAGANHFPAVVEANVGRVPLVSITADRPAELQDCGAPQTMPQRALFGEHARLALALPEPCAELSDGWIRNAAARALDAASGSPAGPVQINVPFREPLFDPAVPLHDAESTHVAHVRRGERRLDRPALEDLASELAREPSGAIVCGPLAPATTDAVALADAVTALARALDWPILADATSGLRHGMHDRSRVLTAADAVLRDETVARRMTVGRVLRIGQPPTAKAVGRWLALHADRTTLIDADGRWLDGGGIADRLVVADPVSLSRDLAVVLGDLEVTRSVAHTRTWLALDRVARATLDAAATTGEWEGRVAAGVAGALVDGANLHVASSMPIRDLDAFSGSTPHRIRITANRGVNGIDGTIATALGIAIASSATTVALLGDLAYLHDLDGLEAASAFASESSVSLTLVVVNNAGGGIFGELPIAKHERSFERLFLTPRSANLGALAGGFGIEHRRLPASELASVLEHAVKGVRVLEVVVERDESSRQRREAFAATSARVRAEATE